MLTQDRERRWDVAYTTVKVPTGYGILMAMINWSHSDLRSMDVLMGTVDAYYAWLNVLKSNKDPKEVCNLFVN